MAYRWDEDLPAPAWQQGGTPQAYWKQKLERARATPATGLWLGQNLSSSLPVFLTPALLRTHAQVIGSTGVGKSFFLEAIIKNLILQGYGVTLLDPHGDLYHRILAFCAWLSAQKPEFGLQHRVIPLDVADSKAVLGFNPVARNARVMTYQVVALMESVRKCWGQDSFEATPRLARWLFNVAYALISAGVTLIQAQHMVNPAPDPLRTAITGRITNQRIRAEWEWLESIKLDKREERIESTLNRIKPFVEHEIIRPMLGQYTKTLDFPGILGGRKILLVNLARQNAISDDNQSLLGTLIVNELLTAAFARSPEERIAHFLVIDEASRFVTKDVCEILDAGRKYKLHLILAHQHLNQLKEKDPEVYYSTLTNARTKVVFGGLNDEDVDLIAKELFTGEFDPNLVKDEIWHRGFAPVETTRTVRGYSSSESSGESSGDVSHSSLASGQVFIPGSDFWSLPTLGSASRTSGSGTSHSRAHQSAYSSGTTETTVPFYEFHEYQELTSRTFRSLEEQLYLKKAQLKRQPNQHAAVLLPGQQVQLIKVATLRELPVTDRQGEDFRQTCIEAAGCYKSPQQAEAELAALEQNLLSEARPAITIAPAAATEKGRPIPFRVPGKIWNRTIGNAPAEPADRDQQNLTTQRPSSRKDRPKRNSERC